MFLCVFYSGICFYFCNVFFVILSALYVMYVSNILFFFFCKIIQKLAEVYNIRYSGPDDNLRGIIMTADLTNGGQFLFNDMDHLHTNHPIDYLIDYDSAELYREADGQLDVSSKPLITSGDLIILSGLAQAAIQAFGGFQLDFYLFGVFYEYVFFHHDDLKKRVSVPLHKIIHGDGGRRQLKINYAVFDNAVEAHVKVKLTEVDSAFDFDGTVHAMTSAIEDPEYASILYFRDYDHRIRLEPEEEMILPLSRHIVVVPLGSQLILHFGLSGKKITANLTTMLINNLLGKKFDHILFRLPLTSIFFTITCCM